MTEKIPEREKIALKGSADWVGNPLRQDIVADILNDCPEGMDAVFECAGQQETIDQALEMVRPGGKLMLIGIPRDERVSFSADKMRRKEVTLINVRRQNRCTENCIELIANGKMEPDFMITHTFKIDQAKEAFDLVAGYKDGVVKALIEF